VKTPTPSRRTAYICALLTFLALLLGPARSHAEVVDRIVAVINDSIITLSELNAATAMALDKLPDEEKKDAGRIAEIRTTVLDDLIEQKLVKQASDKAGIDISEREIDKAVEEIRAQNNMTQEALLVALAANGLTYREYREQLKEQIREVKFINKEFRSKISIQDEDIDDYYRSNIKDFYAPASFRISMIYIAATDAETRKAKLEAVEEGLDSGEEFAELARQYSDSPDASAGGDMGYIEAGELSERLDEAVDALKPGSVSPPVETAQGTYLIKLVDRRKAAPRPLEDVRERIRETLFNKALDERFEFWLTEVKKYAHVDIRP